MQISKRTLSSLLGLSLAITFSACEGKEKKNNENPSEKSAEDESGDGSSEGDDDGATDDDDDDTPVVVDMPPSEECGKMCSLFDQEACGPDEMCTSWICEPGETAWDQSICAPIGEKQKGEDCVDSWAGEKADICAKGLTCFGNVCVDTCIGSKDEPSCPSSEDLCIIVNDGALAMCLLACDPLAIACPDSHPLCIPGFGAEGFICAAPAAGADENDYGAPCMFANGCKPGLICMDPGNVDAPGCEGNGCCTNVCDTSMGDEQCIGEAEKCEQWFDPPPPGYENVGVCIIPQ